MKKQILIIGLLFFSCQNDDQSFCDCIKAGEDLNNKTQEFFNKAPNKEDNDEIQVLKQKKNKLCKPYQDMEGDKLRALQEACDE